MENPIDLLAVEVFSSPYRHNPLMVSFRLYVDRETTHTSWRCLSSRESDLTNAFSYWRGSRAPQKTLFPLG